LVFPEDARVEAEGEDEKFSGRCRLTLCFTLPPGSYATLLLKALGI
jgi:tRNA(Glu) U13 pseudouridine synthase TruD